MKDCWGDLICSQKEEKTWYIGESWKYVLSTSETCTESGLLLYLYLRNRIKTRKTACPWALTLYLHWLYKCIVTLHLLERPYILKTCSLYSIHLECRIFKKSSSQISIQILNCKIYTMQILEIERTQCDLQISRWFFSELRAPVSAITTFANHVVLSEPIIHLQRRSQARSR